MRKCLFMAALLITATLTLTACGDDEPQNNVTATATYNLSFSRDMLDACNVFITYKAENGRNVMEAITSTGWTKTVTSNQFPAEFGVMYKFSTKSDAELVKEKYDLTCNFIFSCNTSKGAIYSNTVTIIDSKGVSRDKVISTLDKLSGKSTGYRVSIDGIFSKADNMRYD